MFTDKKPLQRHAVSCILRELELRIRERAPSVDLAYTLHRDRQDCWDATEMISDYYCAVNLSSEGYTANGEAIEKKLRGGDVVCGFVASIDVDVQVFAVGCEAGAETVLAVLAEIGSVIHARGTAAAIYARHIIEGRTTIARNDDYAEGRVRATQSLTIEFHYIPSRPALVFAAAEL